MSARPWVFLINTFLVNTVKNFKKTLTLSSDHLSKLESQNSDAEILAMYNTFLPLQQSFDNLYSQWQLTKGTYEGKTQGFEERLQHFSVVQINVWRGIVFNIFPENSPTEGEIFYNDRKPFQQGTYEQRVNAFETLGNKLAEYTGEPALVALSLEVLSAHNELKTLRDAQQNKEGATAILSAGLENARVIVCEGMYSNLGLLMSKYKHTPEVVGSFYDLSLLRKTGDDPILFKGRINSNTILNLNDLVEPGSINFTPTSKVLFTNTSENPLSLTAYLAETPTSPPGEGPQFTAVQGQTIEIIAGEVEPGDLEFVNIQNTSGMSGSWEIEIIL